MKFLNRRSQVQKGIDEANIQTVSFYFSYRFLIGVIGFFGYMLQYMQKIDMSIGIVCMVNHTAVKLENEKNSKMLSDNGHLTNFTITSDNVTDHCVFKETKLTTLDGTFVWSKRTQGFILSAYFYGYILTQIIAGILASKFGSKIMLFIGMFTASLLTILVPVCARFSYIALIINRFLTGIGQSFFMPGMSALWFYWSPPNERSRLVGMSHSGGMVGNIFALLIGGYLCSWTSFDGGWPSIYYLFGTCGIIWVVIMFILFSDTPATHKFISQKEKDYIIEQTESSQFKKNLKIPWKSILTSKACIAIFVSHFCNNWGIFLLITELPSFMREVLKFNIKSNGLMSSLPFLSCFIFINISSLLGDRILKANVMSRKNVRKIFNGIGLATPVGALIGLSFVTCSSPHVGVALLCIGMALMGFSLGAGYYVNINDVSGPYTGVVFGISNSIAGIPGLICPYLTSALTVHQTQKEWQIVFIISACVYLFGLIIYSLFSESDLQPWAKVNNNYPVNQFESSQNNLIKMANDVDEKDINIVKF